MDLSLFDFHLPAELIAQHPSKKREQSRLLVYRRSDQSIQDLIFSDIVQFFDANDVIVRNNTKVIPARLFGTKVETSAHVELLLLKEIGVGLYQCMVGNAKVVKVGTQLSFGDGRLLAECQAVLDEGIRLVQFKYEGIFLEVLESLGEIPLPPYIKAKLEDPSRYQTVYAKIPGSAAAPTAGFHFTEALFDQLKLQGVTVFDITLQIGLGTFKPVKATNTNDHVMHYEQYVISQEVADALNTAKLADKKITALGTTSLRSLEANHQSFSRFEATDTSTNIFITPGYTFQAIDKLITNFHLPKSTLVMLVSALIAREEMLRVYQHAIDQRYRFFSFGDAMLIL
jgi:S-adenosylmethionine:tRNA ribosyltransferase-isomerase